MVTTLPLEFQRSYSVFHYYKKEIYVFGVDDDDWKCVDNIFFCRIETVNNPRVVCHTQGIATLVDPNALTSSKQMLEKCFKDNYFPRREQIRELSKLTGKTEKSVYRWFHHKRNYKPKKRVKKRGRNFTEWQKDILLEFFEQKQKPTIEERKILAVKAKLGYNQVNQWFINARVRY